MEDLNKLISKDFSYGFDEEYISENDLTLVLADRVAYMLDNEIDLLMSTLYRLDVLEVNIQNVLSSEEPNALGLARLIVERQKQKIETRRKYSENR